MHDKQIVECTLSADCISKEKRLFQTLFDREIICRNISKLKRSVFCDMTPYSRLKWTDVSEKHVASIFRVEE
jgi:hypothetical protein